MENENSKSKGGGGFRPPKFNIMWAYIALAAVILGWGFFSNSPSPITSSWSDVRALIAQNEVEKIVVINRETAEIFLKKSAVERLSKQKEFKGIPQTPPQLIFIIGSVDSFREDLDSAKTEYGINVPYTYETRKSFWGDALTSLLPLIIIVAVWILIMRNMSRGANGGAGGGGGIFSVGKAKAQVFDKENANPITFKDVAGLEEAKVEIMEIVDFLKRPEKYRELGGKIPKGALLAGPPGTGKTLLAKAVAGEANVPFFSISGSDFVEMFVGVGASRVRDLFRQAKEKAPCIVFIDEIDAIGRARGKNVGFSGNDERENTLNQLLTEMDGFGTNSGVIILAATNRADILDKALMRAGRFDRQIEVGLPDIKEREAIFNVHLQKLKLVEGLDREFLAKQTPGFSGADIANVCNEAALIAARNDKTAVDKDDFLSAVDRIVGGLERRNTIITPQEKRAIAFHEAGHATVSWLRENANPLIKVTIIPRGKALGAAWYLPEERQITTREQIMDEMASAMGGRVAEMQTFGRMSTGAISDLEKVTKMAHAMVVYYGMSPKIGHLSYYDSTGQSDYAMAKPYSEQTAQDIDKEVKAIVDEALVMATETLSQNRDKLSQLAEVLLEKEVIFTDDMVTIFGPRKKDIEKAEADKIEKSRLDAKAVAESALALQAQDNSSQLSESGQRTDVLDPSLSSLAEAQQADAAQDSGVVAPETQNDKQNK